MEECKDGERKISGNFEVVEDSSEEETSESERNQIIT